MKVDVRHIHKHSLRSDKESPGRVSTDAAQRVWGAVGIKGSKDPKILLRGSLFRELLTMLETIFNTVGWQPMKYGLPEKTGWYLVTTNGELWGRQQAARIRIPHDLKTQSEERGGCHEF